MAETSDPTVEHHARLNIGEGFIRFMCCDRTDQPLDVEWDTDGPTGVILSVTPQQAYEAIADHLTRGHEDDPDVEAFRESSDTYFHRHGGNVRTSVQLLADELDTVDLMVNER